MTGRRWTRLALLGLLAAGACRSDASPVPYYTGPELTPEWLSSRAATDVHRIPDFTLTDQTGTPFTAADLDGHVVVASFFFTRCTSLCPTVKIRLATLQAAYLDDPRVILVSHSVTPELDSVSVLARYAAANGVVPGKWHLLTGSRKTILDLAEHGYWVELEAGGSDAPGTDLAHTETLVLLDGHRRIRGVYSGSLMLELDRLKEDIGRLLAES